jgi:hypothetical protein
MSFGFPEEPEINGESVISNAIAQAEMARNQRILFFAAAANDGGNQMEMFPARHQSVCSVRATDHHGKFSPFNPPPSLFEANVIGTLGEQVTGAGLCGSRDVIRTGTSVATPIAAGIAATLLGYAETRLRVKESLLDRKMVDKLKRVRGMRSMLWQLGSQMSGGKERYLHMGRFLRASDRKRDAILANAT